MQQCRRWQDAPFFGTHTDPPSSKQGSRGGWHQDATVPPSLPQSSDKDPWESGKGEKVRNAGEHWDDQFSCSGCREIGNVRCVCKRRFELREFGFHSNVKRILQTSFQLQISQHLLATTGTLELASWNIRIAYESPKVRTKQKRDNTTGG